MTLKKEKLNPKQIEGNNKHYSRNRKIENNKEKSMESKVDFLQRSIKLISKTRLTK